jgi:hypothetical protein
MLMRLNPREDEEDGLKRREDVALRSRLQPGDTSYALGMDSDDSS